METTLDDAIRKTIHTVLFTRSDVKEYLDDRDVPDAESARKVAGEIGANRILVRLTDQHGFVVEVVFDAQGQFMEIIH